MESDFTRRIKPYFKQIQPLVPISTDVEPRFYKSEVIKAIVFDIYGTLIISASGDLDKSQITSGNLNEAIVTGGFSWVNKNYSEDAEKLLQLFQATVKKHQKELAGKGFPYPEVDIIKVWEECTAKATENNWLKVVGEVDLKLLTVVFELLSNQVWPMPDLSETLQKLFDKNIPLGIVSNAQFYTPVIVNYFLKDVVIEDDQILGFDKRLSIFSYKISRSKPDVFLFNELKESFKKHYNLKPHQVLFVGNDMVKDVWTAKQAGFKTALLAADQRSLRLHKNDERTQGLVPDFNITELKQLFKIVDI